MKLLANSYLLELKHTYFRTTIYHEGNYSKSRQELQDAIVNKLLDGTMIHDTTNGRVCKTPTEPWIVFTAGVMVRNVLREMVVVDISVHIMDIMSAVFCLSFRLCIHILSH